MTARLLRGAVVGVCLAVFSSAASAQSASGARAHGADVGVAFRFGTPGFGLEVSKWLVNHLGARVGVNFFSKTLSDHKQTDITFDATIKLQAVTALLDLYPSSRGAFHLTAGLMTNPVKATGDGKPTGGTFEINHHTYQSSEVGTLTGTGKFSGALPYLGLGFGTAARGGRIAFLFDLGVAFGKPKISLNSVGGTKSNDPGLQSDLDAQIASTQDDLNKIPGYPVLSFGLMVKF
jgi:hypothetical protein